MSNAGTTLNKSMPVSSKPKERTKAKKRYLKAKKERRKNRKTLTKSDTGGESGKRGPTATKALGSSGEGEDEENSASGSDAPDSDDATIAKPKEYQEEQRPRKRRKLDEADPPESELDVHAAEDDLRLDDEEVTVQASLLRPRSPTPVVALPSFPLPKRPDAPSKATLALQGLDKALIEAEIVDPSGLLAFDTTPDSDGGTGLSERTRRRLRDLGISELFAVQTAVIPFLLPPSRLRSLYLPYDPPQDLCVSAPTGSGKTLAYVLPITEALTSRIVTRLRALVVLPTRDLVNQVRETFEAVAKGRGLKIGTATGQHSFAHEQAQLVAERSRHVQGGSSKVDILISTPGRLIDHLNGTQNFSLQHLRYLVIDEADRLLAQSFQDWLAQVLSATKPPQRSEDLLETSTAYTSLLPTSNLSSSSVPHPDALAPAFLHLLDNVLCIRTDVDERKEPSCQKLLFSATLTRDPSKIAALDLHNPKYFVVQSQTDRVISKEEGVLNLVMEKFSMPSTLSEHMIVCDTSEKPLMLFYLVHARAVTNALIFTKSAESTARLVRLFEFFESAMSPSAEQSGAQIVAKAYSSDLSPGERKMILEKFKNQEIHILVCSDLISRGIDISHVSHVVSYDAPVDIRKYVHRVGRTARAGRSGDAWTLVEEQEARHFKTMLKGADHLDKVKRLRVSEKDVAALRPTYESALIQLKEAYARSTS
ncbi:DEAD-domain-containing protein [Obba rivulosa]|uniref:ATP-dependent RNA helicase n=1 Tax=Obba rivulosa TaxID=1052685 RepID=A0A8E2J5X4_9APHY|nr:DEAD-domain-containing protein [Obba rivulosa]